MTEETCQQCGFMTSNSLLFGLHQQYVHGKQRQNTSSPVVENGRTVPTVSGAQSQARTDMVRRLKVKTASRYASAAVDAAKFQLGNATVKCTGKREMNADVGRKKAINDKRKCTECPYFAPTSARLKIHLAFHRPNANGYKCGKCEYWGTRISDTTRHQHIHHPNYGLKFKCGKCDYWGTDVARHQLVVHPNYDVECRKKSPKMVSKSVKTRVKKANVDSSCQKAGSRTRATTARRQRRARKGKSKKNAGNLGRINTTEGNRRQCPICPYIGYSMERLERHKFFHQPNPNGYKCGKCDYWGHRVAATTRHQLVHQPNYGLKNQDKSLEMVSKYAKSRFANANPVSSSRMTLSSTRAATASQH